jgi:hypothetical protein
MDQIGWVLVVVRASVNLYVGLSLFISSFQWHALVVCHLVVDYLLSIQLIRCSCIRSAS